MPIKLFDHTVQLTFFFHNFTNLLSHVTKCRFQNYELLIQNLGTFDTKPTNYQSFLLQTADFKITNYQSFLLALTRSKDRR